MAVMSEVLPIILWTWVGTPIASIGVVVALMLADTQWGRAHGWRQGACGATAHTEIVKEKEGL